MRREIILCSTFILLAGCLGFTPITGSTPTEGLTCSLEASPGEDKLNPTGTAVSASNLDRNAAAERALCAETRFLRQQFENASCLDEWNIVEWHSFASENATVLNRTSAGIFVDVVQPYNHKARGVMTDDASTATYLVTPNESYRVSGWQAHPC